MQNEELPLEPPAFHRLEHSLGTIETPHQQHPHEVGVASIGVHIGSRPESPDPHGIHQAVILFVDHMYVSETKKEKICIALNAGHKSQTTLNFALIVAKDKQKLGQHLMRKLQR